LSGEVGRVVGEVEFSDTLARHGADEPPPSTAPKFGGGHRDGEVYRLSVHGVSQPEIASLRRPEVDLVLDCCDDLGAALPLNRSSMAIFALVDALDR
jgi:hypothetical protein